MAPPNRPADLPKSTNDTTYFSFGYKIFVRASCFQLTSVGENPTYFRTFATVRNPMGVDLYVKTQKRPYCRRKEGCGADDTDVLPA